MLGREGTWRKIELHVALFLVLLSPGYNPPRRRRCLYLSRGKPPSVCAYLSPGLSRLPRARHVRPVPPHSQSTFWQLTLVPRPLTILSCAHSVSRSFSLSLGLAYSRSLYSPRFAVPPQSPTYSVLSTSSSSTFSTSSSTSSSSSLPDPIHLRPPLTPTYPSYPSLYSIPVLYRSRAPATSARQLPLLLLPSGAPTHPNANHPLKVGAPYWRLNHPARGRVEGEGMGRGEQRGGRVAD